MRFIVSALCCAVALGAQEKAPRGRVVDEQGKPLMDVAVCPFAEGERWTTAELAKSAVTRTDAGGRFEIAAAPVRQPDWDHLLLVAPGRLAMAVERSRVDVLPIVLARGGTLSGRVLDAKGAPISGARVQACDYLREVTYLEAEAPWRPDAAPMTAARTDSNGIFLLTGACSNAAWLVADGDGWRQATLGPVAVQDPLSLVLEAAPLLHGRVVDAQNGRMGDLSVQMSCSTSSENVVRWTRTDAEGAFAFTWPGAPVWLSVSTTQGEQRLAASAKVEGSSAEAVLQLRPVPARAPHASSTPRKVQPEQLVSITAIGPDGKKLLSFRAAAHRVDRQQLQYRTEVQQLREFESASVEAVDGVAPAPVFDGWGTTALLVVAKAPGTALAWCLFDSESKDVQIKLEAAGVLAGTVVDARSGKPLAGTRVWSLAKSDRFERGLPFDSGVAEADPGFGVVTTDAAGAFRLDDVAGGKRHVFCQRAGHADRAPELVELTVGGSRLDLRLDLAPLLDLDGVLTGAPATTIGVRLKKHTPGAWTSMEASDYSFLFPVDERGRFRVIGVAPGKYEAQLVLSRSPRAGLPDKLLLEVVDIGFETKNLALDASVARPGRVSGRVTGPVPASRLAVLTSPAPVGNHFWGFLHYTGPIVPLAPDGSFSVEEPPGERILIVIDLWTGAMLHRESKVQVAPDSQRTVELSVDATAVPFRIVGAPVDWHCLEIVPSPEHWPEGVGQIGKDFGHGYFLRMGARLEPGRTSGTLYLPAAPCALRLRAAYDRLHMPADKDVLAQVTVDPKEHRSKDVEIAVPAK